MSYQCNQHSLDPQNLEIDGFAKSHWDHPTEELKRLFDENGYLYFPHFFSEGQTELLRENYLLKNSETHEYGVKGHAAYNYVRSPEFIAFSENKNLRSVAERLLGEPSLLLKRRILRHYNKNTIKASPAHIDFSYLDQGDDQVVTAWIPLGDCSLSSGGLIYLDKSHDTSFAQLKEQFPEDKEKISLSSNLNKVSDLTNKKWLGQNFKGGDLLLHNPYIIHATLNCQSDHDRVSVDLRFMGTSKNNDPRWTDYWSADDGY